MNLTVSDTQFTLAQLLRTKIFCLYTFKSTLFSPALTMLAYVICVVIFFSLLFSAAINRLVSILPFQVPVSLTVCRFNQQHNWVNFFVGFEGPVFLFELRQVQVIDSGGRVRLVQSAGLWLFRLLLHV